MNKIFTQVEEKLSVIIYVVMLAITFANVIGRYCFHASISATDEITTNIFVLLSVIGTGVAAKSRSHLGLSVLTELMRLKCNTSSLDLPIFSARLSVQSFSTRATIWCKTRSGTLP